MAAERLVAVLVVLAGCTGTMPSPGWAMEAVGAPADPPDRSGITVAVLDARPDAEHPALVHLGDRLEIVDHLDRSTPASSHATAVVGLLAGADDEWRGLVPSLRVVSAVVCDEHVCSIHAIKRALDAVVREADVISISLSSPPDGSLDGAFDSRIADAVARGALVVVSVGNRGPEGAANGIADLPGVVSVAAAGPEGVASFSSKGRSTHCALPSQCLIPVVPLVSAPGIAWAPQLGGYAWMEGTSFAVPFVAAAAALAFPLLDARDRSRDFQDRLATTSRPFEAQVLPHDARAGYGMLDVAALLAP